MMTEQAYNYIQIGPEASDAYVSLAEEKIGEEYKRLVGKLTEKNLLISGAESCTGGLIAKCITDISGASATFCGTVVSYTNDVKIGLLGVDPETIEKYTEVSRQTAHEMASRACMRFGTNFAYSTTGYAGPTGGTDADPTGTVYVGIASRDCGLVFRLSFSHSNTREQIRLATALFVAEKLQQAVSDF